jgi:hypothetical protein
MGVPVADMGAWIDETLPAGWCEPGGKRTTGLEPIMDPAGDATKLSRAIEDLRLMATLGEYILPPYMLVRRLENPPIEPSPLPLPLPKPCWLGRRFRGINMKDLSNAGKIYRIA